MNNIHNRVSLIMHTVTQEILDNSTHDIYCINWNLYNNINTFTLTLIVNVLLDGENREYIVDYELEKDMLNNWSYLKNRINNYCNELGWL